MGSYYSGDHIARDNIHTGITTFNMEEPPQKYCLGKVGNISLRRGFWLVVLGLTAL